MSKKQDEVDIDASSAPLIEHLIELRQRLMWAVGGFFIAFLFCFFWAKDLFNFLVQPFKWAVEWAGLDHRKVALIYTAPQEFFFTQIKIAMFGGLVLAFPLIAAQIYKFIAPGLYRNERKAFVPFLVASPLLFLLGATLVYSFFMPMVMWFFLAMEQTGGEGQVDISLLPKVSEYLGLIMTLIFAFGLVFQLPVVTTLLARAGLATSEGLKEKRKYAIVFAFIAAAVLTPPDPVSQIGLALPTIILYEISIYTARMVERERAQASETDEDETGAEADAPAEDKPAGGSGEAELEEQGRGSMP
ncbi:MAG: twin-arginine translocase subunit TatC [Zhengella sp.]|uniref:twin-arginine translocase subunit TatC n=1 Tax=Zhengella sp. TaxID=2282762 RepID=UPI001D79FCD2|nr:twin-arginine translocase subunit TatC [Notoacmeibacter sp.]MCC0027112.1 twin-arginine translocase subunit TatC [Brucellaceae bacterium]